MGTRLKRGKVAFGYQRGWNRSVGEIFAEDYAQTQLETRYGIPWLSRPTPGCARPSSAISAGCRPTRFDLTPGRS